VAEKIMTMKVSTAVDALKKFRIMLDPPMDLVQKVARHLLDKADCPKDFVRTWVYLFSRSVMGSPWLLQRLFEVTFCEKESKTEFRRRGGKCLHLKLSEEEIPVDTLAQYCGRFLKLGFDFRSDVQALLSRKFEEDPDVRRCAQALKILKEAQVVTAAEFKGWYRKVGARSKLEVLEEAMSAPVQTSVIQLEHHAQVKLSDKKKLVGLIQAAKAGDSGWRSRADEWILEVKERYKQAFESLEKEWIEWRQSRLRKSPREYGTIEILCTCPTKDRVLVFDCNAHSRPEILWTEVQSWLKSYGEDLSRIEKYQFWDENGQLDLGIERNPVDGERFVCLIDWGYTDFAFFKPTESDSIVQTSIRKTKWRRMKSIYDMEIVSQDGRGQL
jgi:hypothetical protein